MNNSLLLQQFDLLATAPGGVAQLRELILTLAVQGKLVPQNPADEPASELLKRIRAEKDRLIAEKVLKREKEPPALADGHLPFELPTTWCWVALGDVIDIVRGITFPATQKTREAAPGRIACLRTSNVQHVIEWDDLLFVDRTFMGRDDQLIQHHDIVMSMANSRELVGKVALIEHIPHAEVTFGGFLGVLRPRKIDPRFAMAVLRTPHARSQLIDSSSQTTNIANVSLAKLRPLPFPLPPEREQARIATRVEELMRVCDALEATGQRQAAHHRQLVQTLLGDLTADSHTAWQRVAAHFDTLLDRPSAIDALEQTILQLAVRGQLVPQDSTDEPASELLKRIRAEKDRLIAAGKIKRDKPLAAIGEDEQPFGLPPGWEWVRVADLCSVVTDGEHATPERCNDPTAIPLVTAKNVRSEIMDYTQTDYVPRHIAELCWRRCKPQDGDILMVSVGATLGRLCVLRSAVDMVLVRSVTVFRPVSSGVQESYLALHLMAPITQSEIWRSVKQSAQPCLYLAQSARLKVALPPLPEQARIVARVAQLRQLCANLRQRLSASQTTQAALAHALLADAVSLESA
ncbi:MAG: hypothetical protein RLZZ352_322 [Pseudomonadota bacterium]|jgi:type I restriction enzyme S subunit